MNRDFYFFGIFFLGLYVIAALFQSSIFFQIGYQIYSLSSFANWFLVLISTSLIGYVFMLKYYHHKGYRFAFTTGAIAVIAGLCQNILFYLLLLLMLKELQRYYIPSLIFSLGAGLLYAISLVFSKAGKNLWLRTMGIFILIVGSFSVYLLVLSLHAQPGQPNSTITQFSQWVTLAGSLVPVPLIMFFYYKLKSLKADKEVSSQEKSSEFLYALGGYGTWYFIGTRPDRFAAAVPVAGEGDPALASNMLDVDIWAFHGANDRNVPVSGSREVIEAIRKAGGGPRYTESPDGGHSWKIVEDTPGVLDWLFAQKRD